MAPNLDSCALKGCRGFRAPLPGCDGFRLKQSRGTQKNAYPWLISLHRFAVHYSLLRMIDEDPISAIERLPHWAMTRLNSRRRIERTLSTPAWPKDATPHIYGRPMHIARAPRARALKTSVPRRNPPSTKTGTRLRTT